MSKKYKVESLQAYAEKIEGTWIAAAYIDTEDKRVVFAISHGKKMKVVLREVMTNAIKRVEENDEND